MDNSISSPQTSTGVSTAAAALPAFVLVDSDGNGLIDSGDIPAPTPIEATSAADTREIGAFICNTEIKTKNANVVMCGNVHDTGGSEPLPVIAQFAIAVGKSVTAAFEWDAVVGQTVQDKLNATSPSTLSDPATRKALRDDLIHLYATMMGYGAEDEIKLKRFLDINGSSTAMGLNSEINAILDSRVAGAKIVFYNTNPSAEDVEALYGEGRENTLAQNLTPHLPTSKTEVLLVSNGVRHGLKDRTSPWEKKIVEDEGLSSFESLYQKLHTKSDPARVRLSSVFLQPDIWTMKQNVSAGYERRECYASKISPIVDGLSPSDADLYIYYLPPAAPQAAPSQKVAERN